MYSLRSINTATNRAICRIPELWAVRTAAHKTQFSFHMRPSDLKSFHSMLIRSTGIPAAPTIIISIVVDPIARYACILWPLSFTWPRIAHICRSFDTYLLWSRWIDAGSIIKICSSAFYSSLRNTAECQRPEIWTGIRVESSLCFVMFSHFVYSFQHSIPSWIFA